MSIGSQNLSYQLQGELYHEYCKISKKFKPKIKEIISLTMRNLMDLTSCLIQTHHSLVNPKFSDLKIPKLLDYEIEAWHNEILSCALASRRNLGRLMTDLKYMLSSVNGTESLFMEMTKLTNSIREKWTPTICEKTGSEFRSMMLDVILITDPSIKGFIGPSGDLDLNQRRASDFTDQTRTFLDIKTNSGFDSMDFQFDGTVKQAESLEMNVLPDKGNKLRFEEIKEEMEESIVGNNRGCEMYETRSKIDSFMMMKNKEISYGTGTTPMDTRRDDILGTYSTEEKGNEKSRNICEKQFDIAAMRQSTRSNKKMANTRSEPTFEKKSLDGNYNREVLKDVQEGKKECCIDGFEKKTPEGSPGESKLENKFEIEEIRSIVLPLTSRTVSSKNSPRKVLSPFNSKRGPAIGQNRPRKEPVTPLKEIEMNRKNSQETQGTLKTQILIHGMSKPSSKIALKTLVNENLPPSSSRKQSEKKPKFKNSQSDSIYNQNQIIMTTFQLSEEEKPQYSRKGSQKKLSHESQTSIDRNSTVSFNGGIKLESDLGQKDENMHPEKQRSARRKNKFINESLERLKFNKKIPSTPVTCDTGDKIFEVKQHPVEEDAKKFNGLAQFSNGGESENIFNLRKSGESRPNKNVFASDSCDYKSFYQNNTPHKVNKQLGEYQTETPTSYPNQKKSEKSVERIKKYVHESSFDIKQFLTERDSEKIHLSCKGLQKVVLSNDGNYLIYGGEGLNVLDMTTDDFKIIRNDKKKTITFNSIKVLHNDNILITEPITNDLVVYNTVFQEVHRIKGIEGAGFDNEAIRNSTCSNEGQYFVWYKGSNKVSIVNTVTLRFKDIPLLKSKSLPVATATNKKLTKLGVLSVTEDSRIFLNFWEKGKKIQKKEIASLSKKLKAAMTMEVSDNGEYLFVGGCDRLNVEKGKPVISVFKFDSSLEEIDTLRLHADSMKNVFRIRKIPNSDALVVSGFEILSIIEFRGEKKLVELKQLRGLHSGEIFDLVLRGREIFSVSSSDSYIHKF